MTGWMIVQYLAQWYIGAYPTTFRGRCPILEVNVKVV